MGQQKRHSLSSVADGPVADRCAIEGARIGRILTVEPSGRVIVDFPGGPPAGVPAKWVSALSLEALKTAAADPAEVLLLFEENDPLRPIIVDTLHSPIAEILNASAEIRLEKAPDEVLIDGRRITLQATREVVLQCGKASITLTREGSVIIRGAEIVSRATGAHRIRGGSVRIN
jgi:hypothetical protein